MDATDLEKIDSDQIFQRVEEAQAAFEVIEEYIQSGRLSAAGRQILELISTDEP